MRVGICFTSDTITFDQNSAAGKDLSNDTQVWVIGSMKPQIYMKMLKIWVNNLQQKFLHLAMPW